jgi:dynein heavy chain 2
VAPLSAELADAGERLAGANASLSAAQGELASVDARVSALKKDFAARTAEAESLRARLAKARDTLARAEALLASLSGERTRWAARRAELEAAARDLPRSLLRGLAFAVLAGGRDEAGRAALCAAWDALAPLGAFSPPAALGADAFAAAEDVRSVRLLPRAPPKAY